MLDDNKFEQFGTPRTDSVKGVTIHNTHTSLTAREHAELMANAADHYGTHYFVDGKEVVQMMPESWCVWHTGKAGLGDYRTIAIEICQSTCDEETYLKAQENAKRLVLDIIDRYGLTKADIYFHLDFNTSYCPHRILDIYKTKKNFIRKEFR